MGLDVINRSTKILCLWESEHKIHHERRITNNATNRSSGTECILDMAASIVSVDVWLTESLQEQSILHYGSDKDRGYHTMGRRYRDI